MKVVTSGYTCQAFHGFITTRTNLPSRHYNLHFLHNGLALLKYIALNAKRQFSEHSLKPLGSTNLDHGGATLNFLFHVCSEKFCLVQLETGKVSVALNNEFHTERVLHIALLSNREGPFFHLQSG